jgi:hypothetical protein
MPKQAIQVERPGRDAGDPVPQRQLADADRSAGRSEALPLPQPRESVHDDLDAGHLARQGVAGEHPLAAAAAAADRHRDGAHPEGRDRVQLASDTAARQARSCGGAARTPAGEKPLADRLGICEDLVVVARIHLEYVAHLLQGGLGGCQT